MLARSARRCGRGCWRCTVTSRALVGSSAMISARLGGERDGDQHPLPHAAGQLVRVLPGARRRVGQAGAASSSTARRPRPPAVGAARGSGAPRRPGRRSRCTGLSDTVGSCGTRPTARRGRLAARRSAARSASSPPKRIAPAGRRARRPAAGRRPRARSSTCPSRTRRPARRPRRRRRRGRRPRTAPVTSAAAPCGSSTREVRDRRSSGCAALAVGRGHRPLRSPSRARAMRLAASTMAAIDEAGQRREPPGGGAGSCGPRRPASPTRARAAARRSRGSSAPRRPGSPRRTRARPGP